MRNTLAFRIIALSSIWVIISLAVTAAMLVSNHREHIAHHYDEHVAMHLEELTGASHFTDSGRFELAFNPSDPRYNDLYSGWYWEVKQGAKTLKRSESLGETALDLKTTLPTSNVLIHEIEGPKKETLRVHVIEIRTKDQRSTFLAFADKVKIE